MCTNCTTQFYKHFLAKFSESVTEMFQDTRKPYKLYQCAVNKYKFREYWEYCHSFGSRNKEGESLKYSGHSWTKFPLKAFYAPFHWQHCGTFCSPILAVALNFFLFCYNVYCFIFKFIFYNQKRPFYRILSWFWLSCRL